MRFDIERDMLPAGSSAVIANIAGLRTKLIDRLAEGRGALVDTSALEQVDVTFVQLMASASATFAARGLAFALTPLPDPVSHAFARAAVAAPSIDTSI